MRNNNTSLGITLTSSVIFFIILFLVIMTSPGIDNTISEKISLIQDNPVAVFFVSLNNSIDYILAGIALIAILFLYFTGRKKESLVLSSSLVIGYLISSIVKLVVQRQRPMSQIIQETGYSFPSNHAVFSIILFSMIIYFFAKKIRNGTLRNVFVSLNFLLIFVAGISRIFLNVHWFTDVVGGFALGAIIASFVANHVRRI